MKNKKNSYSKFSKYAFICLAGCITGMLMLTSLFCTRLYKDEKFNELETFCSLFTDGIQNEFELSNNMSAENVKQLHTGFVENYDIDIFVYDANGNCILSPDENNMLPLKESLKNQLDNGTILEYDTQSVSDKEPSVFYGDRFYVRYGTEKPQRFYLAAYNSTSSINAFNAKLIVFFSALGIISLLLVRLLLKKNSAKYIAAEEDFLRITEKYSKGDYSEKIEVKSPQSLNQISRYVNTMADNLEKSDETSKTFIANVSHELRTPITTIGGFVDGILDGTITKGRQQEYLVLVSKEIKRLSILISSMLNMTRYESGTLVPHFAETNLTDLAIQTVLMFEKKIDDKQLEIEGLDSDRITAVVDADLIQQVIYNLVENAVKFVNKGGTISFRFEKQKEMRIIGIKNTGEGLKNAEIQQVFDRFYKTDSSRGKDTTGLGLGLSISRKIIHLHNGHIIVKSVQGEYTEFLIELPEKQPQQPM